MGETRDPSTWFTLRTTLDKDATWTVGFSDKGTIDLVIGSQSRGHACTLSLGYDQAVKLRDQIAAVVALAGRRPAAPTPLVECPVCKAEGPSLATHVCPGSENS